MRTITSSSTTCFKRCRREYQIAYVRGYESRVVARPLIFGTAVHACLDVWWTTKSFSGSVAMLDRFDLTDIEEAQAYAMIAGYDAMWIDSDVETVCVEKYFKVVRDGYVLEGKIDKIARIGGEYYCVDHKTSGGDIGAGTNYWTRLAIDDQVSNYFAGARSLGYDIVGFLYDVLRKPKLRLLKATKRRPEEETIEEYRDRCIETIMADPGAWFKRAQIVRLDGELERQELANRKTIADMLRVVGGEDDLEPQTPAACERYGSACPFLPHCADNARLDDQDLFKRKKGQHSELC